MKERVSKNRDTRVALIEAGIKIMFEKGFSNTGIQEVLVLAGIPKGSFYHHFTSKEEFGLEIINHFDRHYSARLFNILNKSAISPLERLRSFCESGKEDFARQNCRGGCLIGNLSQEMSDQNETLRLALCSVLSGWQKIIANCIKEGQRTGEISNSLSAQRLAELFLSGWSAAVARSKMIKNTEPIDAFMEMMFEFVLRAQSRSAAS
jgi:TetR/AcrR family transcriptional repressor of nem operon